MEVTLTVLTALAALLIWAIIITYLYIRLVKDIQSITDEHERGIIGVIDAQKESLNQLVQLYRITADLATATDELAGQCQQSKQFVIDTSREARRILNLVNSVISADETTEPTEQKEIEESDQNETGDA